MKQSPKLQVPFSLGIFEDCTLLLERNGLAWDGAIEYPEKISIRNEYPYIIPAHAVYATEQETILLFYPSGDMHGGYYDGEPTAVLEVYVRNRDDNNITINLVLNERIQWVSDI